MFKNYLKVALRNIRRHWGYSFINIAGLAPGAGPVNARMLCFADPDFFTMFSYPWEIGDRDPRGSRSYFYMFMTAAILVLLTACFNFINLTSAQYLERRRKIGIRGTLGATRGRITTQLLKESLVFSAIAMAAGIAIYQIAYPPMMAYIGAAVDAIAWPLAWQATRLWLRNFANRITPGPGLYILAGGLAFLIALMTAGLRTVRAAQARPVESLRIE